MQLRDFRRRSAAVAIGCSMLASAVIGKVSAQERATCEILSAAQVSEIIGRPMKGSAASASEGGDARLYCTFSGANTRVELSVLREANERSSAERYAKALSDSADSLTKDEPLQGVGVEARYRSANKGSVVVARFGIHVVVVSTNAGREAAVGLVRAVGAKVARRQ